MADMIGVDLYKFAPIYKSYDEIGLISNDVSRELGLPPKLL